MKKTVQHKDPFALREAQKYERPIASREYIIDCLTQHEEGLTQNQLIEALGLKDDIEQEALHRRLRAMLRDGELKKHRNGKYVPIKPRPLVQGYVSGHRDGFGFVLPDDGTTKIFIPEYEMRQVFDGDLVTVRIVSKDTRHRREGKIVEVLARKFTQIVGRFFQKEGIGFIEPDNRRISQNVIIPKEHQHDAKSGQVVIADIVSYPTLHTAAIGHVKKILGDYMAPGLEIDVAIQSHGLPHIWPKEVLAEAEKIPDWIPAPEIKKRTDVRDIPFVTIDGQDAKDFDDAVYCELNKKGFRLMVAIADVSHYVKPGKALDTEAQTRGNSVYFPSKVIPMLPQQLSNELCSIKPLVDRLCVVCDMTLNPIGRITRFRFYSAVMKSHARLTYNRVTALLTEPRLKTSAQEKNLLPHLKNLEALYQILLERRAERGALDFEMPEVKVQFGPKRKIKQLVPTERTVAHKIIEETMLCANVCAAKFLVQHKSRGLFRVHDGPNSEKLINLRGFLGELGLTLTGGDLPDPIDYAQLLLRIDQRKDKHVIHRVLLQSLRQAIYSPNSDGHFALAFEAYTHFTSPIRRYPDLLVHRAIKSIIEHRESDLPGEKDLLLLGDHCSMTERRADEATRDVINWLKCEYMLDKMGETFKGTITGVTHFGLFVELDNIYVEGLIAIDDLKNDDYAFDAIGHRLIGERTHKTYRLGHSITVQVVRVSLEDRKIDFIPA